MKTKLVGLMVLILGLFSSNAAAAATRAVSSGACCPFCK